MSAEDVTAASALASHRGRSCFQSSLCDFSTQRQRCIKVSFVSFSQSRFGLLLTSKYFAHMTITARDENEQTTLKCRFSLSCLH